MKCSSLEMWNSGSVASFSLRQSRVTAPNCEIIKGIDVVVLKPRNCKMKTFQRMYKYNIFDIWCLRYIGMALRRVLNGTLCKTDTAVMFSSAKEKTKKENRKKEYENWREAKEIKSFCSVQVRPFHAGLFQINFIFNRASKVTKKKREKKNATNFKVFTYFRLCMFQHIGYFYCHQQKVPSCTKVSPSTSLQVIKL